MLVSIEGCGNGVAGLVLLNCGSSAFGATGLSSLIIVQGVGLKETGIYNNYMLIVTAVMTITNEIFNSIVASFGNL